MKETTDITEGGSSHDPQGLGDIKGQRSLNHKPGPMTTTGGFLSLYQFSVENDSLIQKLAWINRQKDQTEKRLSTVLHVIHAVEEKTHQALTSNAHTEIHHPFIKY